MGGEVSVEIPEVLHFNPLWTMAELKESINSCNGWEVNIKRIKIITHKQGKQAIQTRKAQTLDEVVYF